MYVVDVIQRSGTMLTRRGSIYVGFCPLHSDKDSPSLTVYPRTNSWCCFGNCGSKSRYNGGDSIEFVKQRFGFDYKEAVAWIEDDLEVESFPILEVKPQKIVPDEAVVYYHALLDSENKRGWFYSRGFRDEIIDREMWGWDGSRYCIPVWDWEPGNSLCLGVRRRSINGNGPKYIGLRGMNQLALWGKWYVLGKSDNAICVFDKKEEVYAGKFASKWNKLYGLMKARVFHFPPDFDGSDYCDYRDEFSVDDFVRFTTETTKLNPWGSTLVFAGELDAARAVQDGFAAMSLVNGINIIDRLDLSSVGGY